MISTATKKANGLKEAPIFKPELTVWPDDAPMCDSPYAKWLDLNYDRQAKLDISDVVYWPCKYLDAIGMPEDGSYRVTESFFTTGKYITEAYIRGWVPTKDQLDLNELLPNSGHPGGFYVSNIGGESYYSNPRAKLLKILDNYQSLIYALDPRHYYFKVQYGALFIKYQYIIGGRRIALLKDIK